MPTNRPDHHGDLPAALLAAAADEIAHAGPAALSIRKVAARAGVSRTAAAHHVGDERGLVTALAADGHRPGRRRPRPRDVEPRARPHRALAGGHLPATTIDDARALLRRSGARLRRPPSMNAAIGGAVPSRASAGSPAAAVRTRHRGAPHERTGARPGC